MMKILLIGQTTLHWGRMEFGNIGNYYIMEPMIRGLHKTFGKDLTIKTTMQMSDRFCKEEKVECLPMDLYYGWNDNDLPLALQELSIAQIYSKYDVVVKETPFIKAVIDSDMVIDFSGDIWGDNANFLGENRFLIGLIKDRVAQLLGKKTAMIVGSPGPFKDQKMVGFAQEVYENFDLVTNREAISINLLEEAGFDISKTKSLACPSFLFEPSSKDKIKPILQEKNFYESDRPKVGFIICGWNFEQGPFDKWPRDNDEYGVFADAVEYMISELGFDVYLMSHSNGFPIPPKPFELIHGRDYPVIKQLEEVLVSRGIEEHLYTFDGIYDAWDTKAIIGEFDMLVSGRVHGAIAGLSQAIPTVIIDYGHEPKAHKLKGFAQLVGVEQLVADPTSKGDIINKISNCYSNVDCISTEVKKKLKSVQSMIEENFCLLKSII